MLHRLGILFLLLVFSHRAVSQCGGLDIFIANDQSGSVDASENGKSREFILSFAQSLPLADKPGGYRIAVADWDFNSRFVQYHFPGAGKNYTVDFADIISYASSPRVLFNGTDVVLALQQSYVAVQQDNTGRPKVILIMTDATETFVQPALVELAAAVKASGVYIAVLSISTPFNKILSDAASPGGYFIADSYDQLAADAAAFTVSIGAAACQGTASSVDLGIQLAGFQAENCFPGPGAYTLQYTVKNTGRLDWNNSISISLYNGDLYDAATTLVDVIKIPALSLPAGQSYTGTYSGAVLHSYSRLSAIVNFDAVRHPVQLPVYPVDLYPLLEIAGENSPLNNYSNLISRANGNGCTPIANVVVAVQPDSIACGNTVGYAVNICNRGTQDARITGFRPVANAGFSLLHADVRLDSARTDYTNTYFGWLNADYAYAAAADPFGAVYMAGQTNSSSNITTPGAYRISNGGTQDAFLTKFDAGGKRLWATYFGGTGPENGYSVTTDKAGNVYLTGETSISTNIATLGAYQPVNGGSYDAYLAKFSNNGALLWATYYGGSGADYGRSVITDKDGNVYLAGITASTNGIATPGAHQPALGGGNDAFIVKFNSSGVRQWATYYGGTGTESGFGLAVDAAGNVYLTGLTASAANISTPGSFQPVKGAGNDAYLVKFDKNGLRQWGTYLGGNNSDNATAITIDAGDGIYIAGNTSSTNIATANAFQRVNGGGTDAFVAKFDTGGGLRWATCYGGAATENGRHVNAGRDGFIYLSGTTDSNTGIATTGAIQGTYGGNTDAFLVKLDKDGQRQWGTYFGGAAGDIASASVTDVLGKIYLVGATQSTGLATPGSQQTNYAGGGNDAFLMSIDEQASFILKAGNCVDLHYYYDASPAAAGTYDFSFLLQADKLLATDPVPVVQPDNDGFAGVNHTEDNIRLTHQSPACQPGDKVYTAISIPATTTCGDASYVTATITINNTSGATLQSAMLDLNLSGTGARFASELYGAGSHFRYARPDMADPLYPGVKNALVNKAGTVTIALYEIPPGVSTVKADIAASGATLGLTATVSGLSVFYNASGHTNTAVSNNAITLSALPEIKGWAFPAAVSPGDLIDLNNITTTNAYTLTWASATAGVLPGSGSLQQPTLAYQPTASDIANGNVQLSLTVLNADGCDVSAEAYIPIRNVRYDYGDAPSAYDELQPKTPVAAGATLLDGMYLGHLPPSSEPAVKASSGADGDGVEEDGLADKCLLPPIPGNRFMLHVIVTNRSAKDGFVCGFIDWNNDGDFLDKDEKALTTGKKAARSGESNYYLSFNCPVDYVAVPRYMVRLRLSADSAAASKSYGPAPEGETEDHRLLVDNTCGEDICGPHIPSAFTPNADGKNDGFGAVVQCPVSGFRLAVYNRWGQLLYETTNPLARWDGRWNGVLQESAVFVWHCSYTRNGAHQSKKGIVTLIR